MSSRNVPFSLGGEMAVYGLHRQRVLVDES
jgi:hypothetical protein